MSVKDAGMANAPRSVRAPALRALRLSTQIPLLASGRHTPSPAHAKWRELPAIWGFRIGHALGAEFERDRAAPRLSRPSQLIYVNGSIKLTHMEKTQVYLRKEELDALRKAAARSRRSIAALVREAIRKVVLTPPAEGPVAIWDGEPKRGSIEHDSIYDEP
ncbi:MAG TPA: CopG family transcriptional regulator [Xanthobacteraceae bacterium]|nr:CopG family transcriptional regulator [Xanthobacteraceae bacterium]